MFVDLFNKQINQAALKAPCNLIACLDIDKALERFHNIQNQPLNWLSFRDARPSGNRRVARSCRPKNAITALKKLQKLICMKQSAIGQNKVAFEYFPKLILKRVEPH